MSIVSKAPVVWSSLNGVICVYKPAGVTSYAVRKTIIGNICQGMCELDGRPPANHVFIEGDPGKSLSVHVAPSFADNVLIVGPRYQPKDVRCNWATYLGKNTSGVFILGINKGTSMTYWLNAARLTRAYHVKGLLGQATDTYFTDGKVVEKATFKHINRNNLEGCLASMQASHQRQMNQQSGVDPQSQAAYELAEQGPVRPSSGNMPVIYGIRCMHFKPPEFTLEVHCINEYESYLKTLVHEIGLKMHSVATCSGLQCIRHGKITVEQALLRKHWHLQHILDNTKLCRDILGNFIKQTSASLVDHQATIEAGRI